jgi:MarR family transcriptional regulator, organic hydroperoxide resistance regulator
MVVTPGPRHEKGLPPTLDFMRLVWDVHHALQSSSKRLERKNGITGPQRLVVRIVGEFPRSSAGDIARTLRVHPSTLTGILRRLEKRGVIERQADPSDARRALFLLTESGVRIDRDDVGTPEAAVRRVLLHAAGADIEATRRVLTQLATALGAEAAKR